MPVKQIRTIRTFGIKISDRWTLAAMALPPFVCLLVFAYGPIFGWIYAFFDYRIGMKLSQAEFVGFKFFRLAVNDPDLLRVLVNTAAMSLLSLSVIPVAATFAVFLSEIRFRFFRKIIQTTTTLPNFISWVIVYSIFFAFFATEDGFVNRLLVGGGIMSTPFNPLGDGEHVWTFQTLVRLWKEAGFTAIIFFAAISGIDADLYDAAKADGAGRKALIRHITLPGLVPAAITLLLIQVGALLSNGFDQYYVFYNPLVADKIEVLDYYVYKVGLQSNDIPFATALSIFKTVISVLLVFMANQITKLVRGQSIL